MHGLPSPLGGPYGNGVAPGAGLAGLGGFSLGAGALGVRVPGNPQISSVLLVTNLNEEVSLPLFINILNYKYISLLLFFLSLFTLLTPLPHPYSSLPIKKYK